MYEGSLEYGPENERRSLREGHGLEKVWHLITTGTEDDGEADSGEQCSIVETGTKEMVCPVMRQTTRMKESNKALRPISLENDSKAYVTRQSFVSRPVT